MKDHTLKFAVLGFGHIGKRHAAVIAAHKHCTLSAVIDGQTDRDAAIRAFNTPYFLSLEEMLRSGVEADIITIATPNGMHADQALQCLEAGKHIVIEKPMALSKKQADEILQKAEESGKHIFPVVQNRYALPAEWLKKLITGGGLGKIYMVQVNCFWNRDERYYKQGSWHGDQALDGGTLFTQFSHFIDTLYWLFGDITNIRAQFYDFNHRSLTQFEDSGCLLFDFVNGGTCSFNYTTSAWRQNVESTMTVIAENGSVKVGGQYMEKIESSCIKDYELPDIGAIRQNELKDLKVPGAAVNHYLLLENIVRFFNGGTYELPTPEEGARIVDMIERIYACR